MSLLISTPPHAFLSATWYGVYRPQYTQASFSHHSKTEFWKQHLIHSRCTIQRSASSKGAIIAPPLNQSSPDAEGELELVDNDFYGVGYVRGVRAYGLQFKQGPDGIGVFSANGIPYLNKPRIIMEVPIRLLLTVSKHPPWMFFPNIVPFGHPMFEVINSTDPERDWDLRLACLLLLALDTKDNFWQLYNDFLPCSEDCSNLLNATEEELSELQDQDLESIIKKDQQRVREFWTRHWKADIPLKLRRLARDVDRFNWAVSIAQSRCITMTMAIGPKVQEANMLVPYADMMNHSFEPNCYYKWRTKDVTFEVVVDSGQTIKSGEEMTVRYDKTPTNKALMRKYGFSSHVNPWEMLPFSGQAKIHLDSFLSAFNIYGFADDYHFSGLQDSFADGAVIAAARVLPSWSNGDEPFLPKEEVKAAKALQVECSGMLQGFPTSLEQDLPFLDTDLTGKSKSYENAIKYRVHKKQFINKVIEALSLYSERILF